MTSDIPDERKTAMDKLDPIKPTRMLLLSDLIKAMVEKEKPLAPSPEKVFLMDVKSAQEFFASGDFSNNMATVYVLGQDKKVIQKVKSLAEVNDFFLSTFISPSFGDCPVEEPNLPPKPVLNPIHQEMPIYPKPSHYFDSYISNSELSDLLDRKFAPAKTSKFEPGFTITKKCVHDLKTYQGFTETYSYCEKCGAKDL